MELEELRNTWQALSIRVDRLERENRRMARRLCAERATGMQQRLASSYRRISVVGFLLPLLAPLLVIELELGIWLGIVYAVYGIAIGVADLIFARYISKSDYISQPIVDAVAHAVRIRMWQRRLLLFGIAGGVPVLVLLFMSIIDDGNGSGLLGAIAGGIIGLAIGVVKERKYFKMSRQILAELRSYTKNEVPDEN